MLDKDTYLEAPFIQYAQRSTKQRLKRFGRWMDVGWCDYGVSKELPLATFGASVCNVIALRGGKQYGLLHVMFEDEIDEKTPSFVRKLRTKKLQAVLIGSERQDDLEMAAEDYNFRVIARVYDPPGKIAQKDVVVDPFSNRTYIHRNRQRTLVIPFK